MRKIPAVRNMTMMAAAGALAFGSVASCVPGAPASDSEDGQEVSVALVTGSTGGLGRMVALELAATGAHVIVHGRDRERGLEVVSEIEAEGTGSASFHAADLASLAETRAFAETVLREYDRLDVLVNNAGVWLQDEERRLTPDGVELHLQVNYLSHVLLTRLLLPRIVSSAPARIVNVASSAQRPIDFDDPMMDEGYSDSRGYAQSKLAQILFTLDLAEELEGTGVVAAALHPATFMDTEMVLSRGGQPRTSVHDGAEAVLNVALADGIENGAYFNGLSQTTANEQAYDEMARARLRDLAEELIGSEVGGR